MVPLKKFTTKFLFSLFASVSNLAGWRTISDLFYALFWYGLALSKSSPLTSLTRQHMFQRNLISVPCMTKVISVMTVLLYQQEEDASFFRHFLFSG